MIIYLESLIGKLFKILPMREAESTSLKDYLDSLWLEMSGAYLSSDVLQADSDYIAMLNILRYLAVYEVSVKQCKREVFKAIGLCEKVKARMGGVPDA